MSTPSSSRPLFELTSSRGFPEWLARHRVSLAFTTYQAGKLFLLGVQLNGRLSVFERTFNRCLGLGGGAQTLWMSSLYQLWRLENALAPGQVADGYDRLYVPQVGYTTGDLDIHDITVDATGRPVFANTLFNCLATVSEQRSFTPLWRPRFISALVAEDRCHLNGLALVDGRPKYVTAVSRTDVIDGWRDRRTDGGCVIDVQTNEIVAEGLSMPHSPRWHDDRLWLLESGTGYLGTVDFTGGRFDRLAFCPGYLRGLSFVDGHAIVGLSQQRANRTFSGLALDAELARRDAEPRCGLQVIELATGNCVHWVRIDGVVNELYDVVALPGVTRPKALGFKSDEIRRTISIGEAASLDF
jgi:uncharacterized protein (TIGR03032 family)